MRSRVKAAKRKSRQLIRSVSTRLLHMVVSGYTTRKNCLRVGLRSNLIISGSSPQFYKKGNIHIVSVGKPDGQVPAIEWMMPADSWVEVHGHSLALFDSGHVQVAEALIEASGPVIVRESECGTRPSVVITSSGKSCRIDMLVKYGDFQLVDRGVSAASSKWARWHEGERVVTYLLEEPKTLEGRSRLVVVFSAIGAEYDFTYNYRSSLSNLDTYRLYVLDDFGKRGSYYFADHRDESIYRSVQLFLRHIFSSLGVAETETTFAGSSKGGTAALIHGLPLGVRNIVVGAPQFKPGTYLKANAPEILEFIAGGSNESARKWLDEAAFKAMRARPSWSRVRVIVGKTDHHYEAHAVPLEAALRECGIDVSLMVMQGVNHQEIGRPFSAYLRHHLRRSITQQNVPVSSLLPYELSWQLGGEGNIAVLRLWIPVGEAVAIRVYARGKIVESFAYSDTEVYAVANHQSSPMRFRVYRRSLSTKRRLGVFTTHWLRPQSSGF